MLTDGPRLGAHLPLAGGMVKAADRAIEIGATALQVFSDNPTAWQPRAAPSPELPAFRARLSAGGVAPLAIHASYLINLAGADPAYHDRSVALLAAELRSARRFGASIVNVHIGSHGGAGIAAGIERLVTAIRRTLEAEAEPEGDEGDEADEAAEGDDGSAHGSAGEGDDGSAHGSAHGSADGSASATTIPPVTITLENSAGGGFGLGADLDDLSAIAAAVDASGIAPERIGFCLDLAHAWSAGHDLADPATIDAFVDGFDRRIGLHRLHLVHLNDSKSELGSRLDRHQHVGAGRIGEAGMAHLLRHPGLAHVPWILETPGMDEGYDAINMTRAVALARGEPLAPLPPGALTLRGSRSRATKPVDPPVEAGPGADEAADSREAAGSTPAQHRPRAS